MPDISQILARVGIKTAQAGLMVGGLVVAFVFPMIFRSFTSVSRGSGKKANVVSKTYNYQAFQMLGMLMMVGGAGWFLADSKGITASAASIQTPLPEYDTIGHGMYPNPVNNLTSVKPRNRFDKQSNFILNDGNASFDNYINDIVINEARQVGVNLLDKSNYPVRMEPWQIKTLIPTTPTTPERDFNTVKMIA